MRMNDLANLGVTKSETVVYQTTEYDLFKFLKGNRTVMPAHVKHIIKSIKSVGWIHNPIIVNEKFEIIEGQHRYMALKELGLPIEFIIQEQATVKECQALNTNNNNWKGKDFINCYVELGIDDYAKLKKYCEDYHMNSTSIFSIATNHLQSGQEATHTVNNGLIKFDEDAIKRLEHGGAVAAKALTAKKHISGSKTVFASTVAWIVNNVPNVNPDYLIDVITERHTGHFVYGTKLVHRDDLAIKTISKTETLLEQIDALYNYNLGAKTRIDSVGIYKETHAPIHRAKSVAKAS